MVTQVGEHRKRGYPNNYYAGIAQQVEQLTCNQ